MKGNFQASRPKKAEPQRQEKVSFIRKNKPRSSAGQGKRRIGVGIPAKLLNQVEHHCLDLGKSVSVFTEELYAEALRAYGARARQGSG